MKTQTEHTHTPGPWQIWSEMTVGNGREFTSYLIATASKELSIIDRNSPEEAKANARLIAAAPELLAACEMGFRVLRQRQIQDGIENGNEPVDGPQLAQFRAAIDKARGH